MRELAEQLRRYIDATSPVDLDEVRGTAVTGGGRPPDDETEPAGGSGGLETGTGPPDPGVVDPAGTEIRRDRRRWWRAVPLGVAAALVVAVLVIGLRVRDRGENVSTDPATPVDRAHSQGQGPSGGGPVVDPATTVARSDTDPSTVPIEMLWFGMTGQPAGARVALDAGGLDTMSAAIGFPRPPAVDLDRWIVVSITVVGGSCQQDLVALDRDGSFLTPRYAVDGACTEPAHHMTSVALIDRAVLPSSFTLRVPADLAATSQDQLVVVNLDGDGGS